MTARELIEKLQMIPNLDVPVEVVVDVGCEDCGGCGALKKIVALPDRVDLSA